MITTAQYQINATRRTTTITSCQPGHPPAHHPAQTSRRLVDHLNVHIWI
jgi:hypothetical protein